MRSFASRIVNHWARSTSGNSIRRPDRGGPFHLAEIAYECWMCRKAGGDLEQVKFLLGHSSIQTTERYLGSDQEIAIAVNDSLGL